MKSAFVPPSPVSANDEPDLAASKPALSVACAKPPESLVITAFLTTSNPPSSHYVSLGSLLPKPVKLITAIYFYIDQTISSTSVCW